MKLSKYSAIPYTKEAELITDDIFTYKGKIYPEFTRNGNHAQYIKPIFDKLCFGEGIDVGCNRKEWAVSEDAKLCDLNLDEPWNDALNLPVDDNSQDYIFSSHCLEHVELYAETLEHWKNKLKIGGVLFLYLPSTKMEYWKMVNNRKHLRELTSKGVKSDLEDIGFYPVFNSGVDLAYSFCVYGYKYE